MLAVLNVGPFLYFRILFKWKKKKSILEGGYQASSSHTHAHTQGPPPFVSCEIRARHLTSRALSSLPGVMTPDPA